MKQGLIGTLLVLLLALTAQAVQAHGVSASYATVTVARSSVVIEVAFSVTDMIAHFHLDTNADQRIAPEEVAAALPALTTYVNQHLHITGDGAAMTFKEPAGTIVRMASGQDLLVLRGVVARSRPPQNITVSLDIQLFELLGQAHTTLVKVVDGDHVQQAVLSISHAGQTFSLIQERPLMAQLEEFFRMGVKHIFLGYDHLMFLLALILVGGRILQIVKIVTAFTVAHSITLILAALQVVSLPSRLIESGIALSIMYVALENLVRQRMDHRWIVTFFFGLVHGFGFANVLRELGLPTRGLVSSLLAFNVGVEAGQLCVVAVLLPVTWWIARQAFRQRIVQTVSTLIAAFGCGWFVERAFGLSFMPF